jgi:hypothetical protein
MRVYEFVAEDHEIDHAARFVGFANNVTGQYLSLQREERSDAETLPDAGNVWIERDDQQWADTVASSAWTSTETRSPSG